MKHSLLGELYKSLASIIRDADTLECLVEAGSIVHQSLDRHGDTAMIMRVFDSLLREFPTYESVAVTERAHDSSIDDWKYVPKRGTLLLTFVDGDVAYTIRIVHKSGHALGGRPYGTQ